MAWYIEKNDSDELSHSGVKGQKWGVRRYQNEDGTLTEYGKERYKNMMPASAKRDASRAYTDSVNKKLQYLYDNMYKTVSGSELKGSINDNTFVKNGRAFQTESNVSWGAKNKQEEKLGYGSSFEDIEDKYPIFKNLQQAALFAKTLDELPKGSYERAIFDYDPNIKRALYNTSLSEAALAYNAMPTSARKAEEKARKKEKERKKKEEYEARMKANIPASAWAERQKALKK